MTESLILIEEKNIKEENLNIFLMNAKQLAMRSVIGFGAILHVAANSDNELNNALLEFAKVINVTGIVMLMLKSSQ